MKKLKFKKRITSVILLLMVMMLATACMEQQEYPPALPESTATPPAKPETDQPAETFEAELYFLSESGNLAPETASVSRMLGESRAEAVVHALMNGPVSTQLFHSLPEGMSLERMELSGNVANVFFSGMFTSEREWLIARAALAATVCAAEEGIESINVYLENQEPGHQGRELGALYPIAGTLDAYLEQYEYNSQQQETEAGRFENRSATLYFQDVTGAFLLANNRDLSYNSTTAKESLVKILVEELMKGAVGTENMEPVLPASLMFETPVVVPFVNRDDQSILRAEDPSAEDESENENEKERGEAVLSDAVTGECIVELKLYRPQEEYSERLMCGAIVLTITGYLPEVRGVRISYIESDGSISPLNGGRPYSRSNFEDLVGHTIRLAYPESDGSILHWVERAVSQDTVYDPAARLTALFEGPADPGVSYPVFTAEMIREVYTSEETVIIDWERGFTQTMLSMIGSSNSPLPVDRREQLFVFGVINSVTDIPGFSKVWMLENGKRLGSIERIYLGNPLLNNPGIMITE
ncbi:MAG: GerMN domain-containing protein [Clostridia bacterium]|nr:GerMN domain-containing protein [Clostridia bacterium]